MVSVNILKDGLFSGGSRISQTGAPTPQKYMKTFIGQDFCRKLLENERNWTETCVELCDGVHTTQKQTGART